MEEAKAKNEGNYIDSDLKYLYDNEDRIMENVLKTTIFHPLGPKSILFAYSPEFLNMKVNDIVYPIFILENDESFVRKVNAIQYELSHRFVIASKRETLLDML